MAAIDAGEATLGGPGVARSDHLGEDGYVLLDGVSKDFEGFLAVDDVSLSIRKGEIFALLGASGCGKSTLLRILAGFETPSRGSVSVDAQVMDGLPPYRRPTNMMFQSYALFPHMTVEQNVGFGLQQEKMPRAELRQRVDEMLQMVQMSKLAKRKPHQLSGGQQQRVALARSLAKGPKVLLLDEPMGALDKKLRSHMQLELADIIERLGVTCVMVTHDQEEAMTMAHRIAIMDAGRIRQVGSPDEIYEQPNSRFTASFIGSVNLLEGRIADDEKDHITIACADLQSAIYVGHGVTGYEGMEVGFALRPEKIRIHREPPDQACNKVRGVIKDIAYFGSHSVYHVQLPSGKRMLVNATNSRRWASESFTWEDEVWLSWGELAGVVLSS